MQADSWSEIGLHTGQADRPTFEAAARRCYEYAGVPWHGNVVWVSSPLVMALAAPVAALLIAMGGWVPGGVMAPELLAVLRRIGTGTQEDALQQAVRQAVEGARKDGPIAVNRDILRPLVRNVVSGSVASDLRCAAGLPGSGSGLRSLRLAVHASVRAALASAPKNAGVLTAALFEVIARGWYRYISGQRSDAFGLLMDDLYGPGDLREREQSYRCATASACCWYPHIDCLLVSEWPSQIQESEVLPDGTLYTTLSWSDGWSVRDCLPAT